MKPRILARLVADCSELGVSSMSVYFQMLGEVRHAELVMRQQINAPEKTDGRFRGWHRNSYPEKSSTSQALAVIRSKSEACRIGQMHLTHRRGAQEPRRSYFEYMYSRVSGIALFSCLVNST